MWEDPSMFGRACIAAVCVGLAKAGFSGISLISVFLFADLFGAKHSVGLVLPLLIVADLLAYPAFREHGSWKPVWRLLGPALVGLAVGWFLLGKIDDRQARLAIGSSILLMVAVQWLKLWKQDAFERMADSAGFGNASAVCGGVATMLANAAGPVIQLYLISKRLPKMELLGISLRFFLVINLIKLPLNFQLNLINRETLLLNATLIPGVLVGVYSGRYLVRKVPQKLFEFLVLAFSTIAGMKLCFW
jgi:uncharacterized protein